MRNAVRITELIFSSWILSNPGKAPDTIPGRHILTNALRKVIQAQCFPDWLRNELNFIDGQTGLFCPELVEISQLAIILKLTSASNQDTNRTLIEVSHLVARRRLALLQIKEKDARRWGKELRAAVEEFETQLDLHNA